MRRFLGLILIALLAACAAPQPAPESGGELQTGTLPELWPSSDRPVEHETAPAPAPPADPTAPARSPERRELAAPAPAPAAEAATPEAATPEAATPEAATPEAATPEAATPEAATPEAATPAAELIVRVTPAEAHLKVDGQSVRPGAALALAPGRYTVEAEHEAHFPSQSSVDLAPGEQRSVMLELEPLPTAADLTVQAHHPEARLVLAGEDIGSGAVTLGQQPFGDYPVESIRGLDRWRRERAERSIRFERDGPSRFVLDRPRLEYHYDGQWWPSEQALERERGAYQAQRVDQPVYLRATADAGVLQALAERDDLAEWLHGLLRPGDRLAVHGDGFEVLFWARATQALPAFVEAAEALRRQADYRPPWQDRHPPEQARQTTLSEVADLAFALLALRPQSPMLSLDRRALAALDGGIEFQRSPDDGRVHVLAQGGQALAGMGEPLQPGAHQLIEYRLAPGNGAHALSWEEPPERLLVVPERGPRIAAPEPVELLRGEKHLTVVALAATPMRLRQFTTRLDDPAPGHWQTLQARVGPSQALDLREVEMGPHSRHGQYRRIWVFEFGQGELTTQRQVQAGYAVGEQAIETESGLFLRRQYPEQENADG